MQLVNVFNKLKIHLQKTCALFQAFANTKQ